MNIWQVGRTARPMPLFLPFGNLSQNHMSITFDYPVNFDFHRRIGLFSPPGKRACLKTKTYNRKNSYWLNHFTWRTPGQPSITADYRSMQIMTIQRAYSSSFFSSVPTHKTTCPTCAPNEFDISDQYHRSISNSRYVSPNQRLTIQ